MKNTKKGYMAKDKKVAQDMIYKKQLIELLEMQDNQQAYRDFLVQIMLKDITDAKILRNFTLVVLSVVILTVIIFITQAINFYG